MRPLRVDVIAVEGEIDHRDVFLSEEQKESGAQLCACVSRAVGGRLTIDTGHRPDPPRVRPVSAPGGGSPAPRR